MHYQALFRIQLPSVNTSIPALCGSSVYLSNVVHQACFVTSIKVTTLLTVPPVTQCLLLVDSLPPLLQLCSAISISLFTSSAAALIQPHQVLQSWACSRQLGYIWHFLRSPTIASFDHLFWLPTEHLPPSSLHVSRHLGRWVSSILASCPNHHSLLLISITFTLSKQAMSLNSVFLFLSHFVTPRMTQKHTSQWSLAGVWYGWLWEPRSYYIPYSMVERTTVLNSLMFSLVSICFWYHSILHKLLKLKDALLMHELTSLSRL